MFRMFIVTFVLFGASLVRAEDNVAPKAWRWVASNGTVSYTDDEKRIPAAYKDSAELVSLEPWSEYDQATIIEPKNDK